MRGSATRIKLSKAERRQIFEKTHGHCAYCGQEISFEEMQVDHVEPLRKGGADAKENMLPACRSCNHYKSTLSVEQFRAMVERIPETLARDCATFKNGVRFGVVRIERKPVIFYFEQVDREVESLI